ncbi:MAG TPA: hypothetical protein VN397_01335 [Candidatus Methylomirabilis sp.]|nr:hypothetical protein [Candidatus Methylomirabilis sp.]
MIITLTGASGTGKTTLAKRILDQVKHARFLTSITTRAPRDSDLHGEYSYLTADAFGLMKRRDEFAWTATVGDTQYGTTIESLEQALGDEQGIWIMILVPHSVGNLFAFATERGLQRRVVPFFISSPTPDILKHRMSLRGDDTAAIASRLSICESWERTAHSSFVPYVFVEDTNDLDRKLDDILRLVL